MSDPHYIRILVTNPETLAYMNSHYERRGAGMIQMSAFADLIGAKRCRFGFEDRPISFDGFTEQPDGKLWKKHSAGGYALRKHVKAEIKKQRDELLERMRAIQVPGPRTLTSELYEDMFVCIHGQTAYYLTSDDFSRIHGGGFVISYPVFDRSQPVPQKVSAWGRTIKESEYHALREASEAAEQKVEGVAR